MVASRPVESEVERLIEGCSGNRRPHRVVRSGSRCARLPGNATTKGHDDAQTKRIAIGGEAYAARF
jgi:hypothetical protein